MRLTLRELLETADLDTATERSLTAALEQQLGPVQARVCMLIVYRAFWLHNMQFGPSLCLCGKLVSRLDDA